MKNLIISENNRTPEMRYPAIRIQKNYFFYLNAHMTRLLKKLFPQNKKLFVTFSFLKNGEIKFTYANRFAYEFALEAQRARICGTSFIKKIEAKLSKKICGDAYYTVTMHEDGFSIDLNEKLKIPPLDDVDVDSI